MKMESRARSGVAVVVMAVLVLLTAGTASAEYQESFRFAGESLTIGNLVGEIEIEGHAGSEFEVEVSVRGRDAEPGTVTFDADEGRNARLAILFPVDRHSSYVYPEIRGNTTMSVSRSESWYRQLLDDISGRRIKVSGRGSGKEIWADVTVRVPAGSELEVEHGVGRIFARQADASMRLDNATGRVDAEAIRGSLVIDTGSGEVTVSSVQGDLNVDTGSGRVRVEDVAGDRVVIDTGSGSVDVTRVVAERLDVDTGSGGVDASGIDAQSAVIDTGSGSVELALVGMGDGDFEIDTGSGSITLIVPPGASAEIEADTGSGGISLDAPVERVIEKERDSMRVVMGDGAARVRLDTGSGSIRVRTQ